jgi:NTE family protein
MKRALVLSGGGARAAYQAGVLRAVAEIIPSHVYSPFPIICGTSAGALNSLAIGGRAGPFRLRIRKLESLWRSLHAVDVYRANSLGKSFASSVTSIFGNPASTNEPYALLDCSPLKSLLKNYVRFEHLNIALQNGELDAIAVSAISYSTGESVAFFQGKPSIAEWQRSRRSGVSTRLAVDHLMASIAIPGIFKAVKIGSEYFGDGAVRQQKPLSPALRLGADKLFVIGVGNPCSTSIGVTEHGKAPSSAQVIGHLYNSAFADGLESDLESLHNINQLTSALSSKAQAQQRFRKIDVLSITPTVSIDGLAQAHAHELPRALRYLLDSTGALGAESNSSAASYLLFERGFCGALIELGYRDAMTRSEAINQFFHSH